MLCCRTFWMTHIFPSAKFITWSIGAGRELSHATNVLLSGEHTTNATGLFTGIWRCSNKLPAFQICKYSKDALAPTKERPSGEREMESIRCSGIGSLSFLSDAATIECAVSIPITIANTNLNAITPPMSKLSLVSQAQFALPESTQNTTLAHPHRDGTRTSGVSAVTGRARSSRVVARIVRERRSRPLAAAATSTASVPVF